MKLPLFATAALLLVPIAGLARDVAPPADVELARPDAKISIVVAEADNKTLTLRVTNHTGKPFHYRGYSPESPIYQIKEHPVGWCGTGVRQHTLEPGRSFNFNVQRAMVRDPKTDTIHIEIGGVMSGPIPLK